MDRESILECVKTLKLKNCEGYNRIPQRILVDGIDKLINPLTELFTLIYNKCCLPDQWLIAKTIPIHKKELKRTLRTIGP